MKKKKNLLVSAIDLKIYQGNGWDAAQTKGSHVLIIWESDDLIHWSEPRRVPVSEEIEAGCTWAPKPAMIRSQKNISFTYPAKPHPITTPSSASISPEPVISIPSAP